MKPVRRQWNGPLEYVVVFVVIAALLALMIWFFFFAHNPLVAPSAGAF
jgi:hypothetical protein